MSHDRGCPCGKESYEYSDCTIKDCLNKPKLNKWVCPIGYEGCTKNCGNYGCGN